MSGEESTTLLKISHLNTTMLNISILSYLYRYKNQVKVSQARKQQHEYIPKYPFLLQVGKYNLFSVRI